MFIHFYKHDILIFALNCNKISFNIKLHVYSISIDESWLCMMQIFFVHINIII
jgi:hypothetical protein